MRVLVCACARSTTFEVARRVAMSDNRNSTISAFISRVTIIHNGEVRLSIGLLRGWEICIYLNILAVAILLSLCTEEEEDRICPGHKIIYLCLGTNIIIIITIFISLSRIKHMAVHWNGRYIMWRSQGFL